MTRETANSGQGVSQPFFTGRRTEESESEAHAAPIRSESGLELMFRPRGVALVGVSGRAGNPMARPLRYLREQGFDGEIYPVNPKYSDVRGMTCYSSLRGLPGPVDLVLVLVPAAQAIETVREAGEIGASVAIVFASGFHETGAEGAALQAQLAEVGRSAGIRVLGPNCQGLVYRPTRLAATFSAAADQPLPKDSGVAYVGQSGAVGGSILDLATEMGIGLTAWVSTGNQADLDLVEVASVLVDDPLVRVIMLYVEAVNDGAEYTHLLQRAADAGKHIVVLHSGRSAAGRKAATSHTGSMLGNDAGFALTSRRFGVTLVDDVDELLAVAALLTLHPPAPGRRVAFVTTSGGAGILAADRCADLELRLPELASQTREKLGPLIPAFGALANPVDVTAQLFNRGAHAFREVCRIVAEDPGVDAVGVLLTMVVGEQAERLAGDLVEIAPQLGKPLLVAWLAGRALTRDGRAVFREAGMPVFSSVGQLARALSQIAQHPQPDVRRLVVPQDRGASGRDLRRLLATGDPVDAHALLEAIGIQQPASLLVRSPEEAGRAVKRLGEPAVFKLQASGLAHKSDIGGVRTDVTAVAAGQVFTDLLAAAQRNQVQDVEGVLVQETIAGGVELIVGATAGRDGFAPIVTVGFGGVTTELYRDVVTGLAPLSPASAYSMLRELRAWPLLSGFRGAAHADVEAAVAAIVRVSHAVVDADGRLDEFEINPLIVGSRGRGAVAVDVLARVPVGTGKPSG